MFAINLIQRRIEKESKHVPKVQSLKAESIRKFFFYCRCLDVAFDMKWYLKFRAQKFFCFVTFVTA